MSSVLASHQAQAEQQSMTTALGSLTQYIQQMENMTEAIAECYEGAGSWCDGAVPSVYYE